MRIVQAVYYHISMKLN